MNTELEKYRYENDSVWAFLKDMEVEDIVNHASVDVYTKYSCFCYEEGHEPINKGAFSKWVNKYFGTVTKGKRIGDDKYNVFVLEVRKAG